MYDRRVHDTILKNTFIRTMKGFQYATHGKYAYDAYNSFTENNMAPINKRRRNSGISQPLSNRRLSIDQDMFPSQGMSNVDVEYGRARGHARKLKPCRPKVKVSKKFKAKVDVAVAQHAAVGTSTVYLMGNIATNISQDLQTPSQQIYYGGPAAAITTTSGAHPAIQNAFSFFTQGAVLHAASVLFNGKINDVYESNTANNFDTENLVLEVPYMSVQIILHNNTMVEQELDFYECVSKGSTNTQAMDDWVAMLPNANENLSGSTQFWYGAHPGQISSFGTKWSYKKITFNLHPGQTCKHFIKQGPLCYKYKNYLNVSTNWNYPKGVGMSCFWISRQPKLLPNVTGVSAHNAKPITLANYPFVSVETISKYVIEAPELCDDAQKFDKYVMNSYVAVGNTFPQEQLGATADVIKEVYAKGPQAGLITVAT